MPEHLTSKQVIDWLRQQCGHDSRSVDGCGHCEAADLIERQSFKPPTPKQAQAARDFDDEVYGRHG